MREETQGGPGAQTRGSYPVPRGSDKVIQEVTSKLRTKGWVGMTRWGGRAEVTEWVTAGTKAGKA